MALPNGADLAFAKGPSLGPLSLDELTNVYSEHGEGYEEMVFEAGYNGAKMAANGCSQMFSEEKKKDAKVLDIAAGTGLLGLELQKEGFCNIDALDPAKGMLEIAKKRGIYQNFFYDFITEKELPIAAGTYDCITSSGAFIDGHLPIVGLYEFIRLTKPGGYIVFSLREEYLRIVPDYRKLEPLMDKLEEEGRWKKVKRELTPIFTLDKPGVLYIFKKL